MQKTVKKAQKGFTLIELLIVIAVIAILAAIAIPNLLASRKAANESSAISAVRTLITAQETYRSRYGQYAADITALAPGASISSTSAGLVDPLLGAGAKGGFTFTCAAAASPNEKTSYTITAHPTDVNTGTRSFFADQSGVIRGAESTNASQTADVTSDPID